jgi:outer membrane protein assembly factor BamB
MTNARAINALVIAGTLVALAACTGTTQAPSPSASVPGSPSGSPSPSGPTTTFANGQPLPTGCPAGANARAQTVAFVAGGNAWALDPETGDATCLFPAPAPGPFTWNPRGDRALLSGLRIESVAGETLRAVSSSTDPVSSWGHPIGKAVVYISSDGTRLLKVYPGPQREDDITPLDDVRYRNVIYHPSGLALAFVLDTGDGQEIWLSSNLGEDPVRLVFAIEEAMFGALGFTADGRTLLYAAVHGDDAPLLHALDLTDPTINQGLWHGEPGQRISEIFTQPERGGELIAFTVGASCEDARAMVFRGGELATPLADAPSRAVGWIDGQTVLVASGGCDGPSDLAAIDVTQDATVPLVTGVDFAAARTPLLDFVPTLPTTIEEEVGEGVG